MNKTVFDFLSSIFLKPMLEKKKIQIKKKLLQQAKNFDLKKNNKIIIDTMDIENQTNKNSSFHDNVLLSNGFKTHKSHVAIQDDKKRIDNKNTTNYCINFQRSQEIINQRSQHPVFYEESNIITTIREYDVVFITGDTGSGKTTQIPQFILENGAHKGLNIAITQPRRISAISISKRLNEEMNRDIASYKIRFEDTTNENTILKVLTDGMLLMEMIENFLLDQYSIVILDEVHERNLNIEILLPLLAKVLKVRQSRNEYFKIIIMSATLDLKEFESVFDQQIGTYKIQSTKYDVKCFYEKGLPKDIVLDSYKKIKYILRTPSETKNIPGINYEIIQKKHRNHFNRNSLPSGIINDKNSHILVFLPGKKDIYRLISMLKTDKSVKCKILPLHSALSYEEQRLVFEDFNVRKIIISTNIAETSITIPNIVFVIDSGLVKHKKKIDQNIYSYKTEFITKSSANQRAGRAGRTTNGICYRLYPGIVHETFKENSHSSIDNEDLCSIILYLKCLGIAKLEYFSFLKKPNQNNIEKAYNFLMKFKMIDVNHQITPFGLKIAKIPCDPTVARLLFLSDRYLKEMCMIVAILSTNFEIKKTSNIDPFFLDSQSDIISKYNLIISILISTNKQDKCKEYGISNSAYKEIIKSYYFLSNLLKLKEKNEIELLQEAIDIQNMQKIILYAFFENLVIKKGNDYYYNNQRVFISAESIQNLSKYYVFQYIQISKQKYYLKNITIANEIHIQKKGSTT